MMRLPADMVLKANLALNVRWEREKEAIEAEEKNVKLRQKIREHGAAR